MKRLLCLVLVLMVLVPAMAVPALAAEPYAALTVDARAVKPKSVVISAKKAKIDLGGTPLQLTARVKPAAASQAIRWKSSKPAIAKVDENGVVSALKKGTTVISAIAANGKKAKCELTVRVLVQGVSLNKQALELKVGKSAKLKASVTPANASNKKLSWSVDDTKIASISSTGELKAKKAGTTTARVRTQQGNFEATCVLTVGGGATSVTSVALDASSIVLDTAGTRKLVATVLPADAANKAVTWSSSDTAVATVSSTGLVTAKTVGSAKITAKTSDGKKTATCTVAVNPTAEYALQKMNALRAKYPEGMRWTNDNFYAWRGGIFSGGYGCAGFAFRLSDEVFGSVPAKRVNAYDRSSLRAGDILRINNDSHSVIILMVQSTGIVIAEGNYSGKIHWDRVLSYAELEASFTYRMTRYR